MRKCALASLRQVGPAAIKAALPEILKALDETELVSTEPYTERREVYDPNWSSLVIRTIGDLGPESVEPLHSFVKGRELSRDARKEAVTLLGQLGSRAKAAIPTIVGRLDELEHAAADALANIGPEAVPALIAAVRDSEVEFPPRQTTGEVGLVAPWRGPDYAVYALARIGAAALPPLTKVLKTGDDRGRLRAAYSLGEMGAAAKPVLSELRAAASDKDSKVREAAAEAVKKIESAPNYPQIPNSR
jgi:HEAT repeat protein